ncbi:hypothetical protein BDN71DRAFT_1454515 [Pleurotus eryngii]|uniref:Uncharacterized protein n=1 Tax=Pleurotus eryngii TaxID=5323 RepID=A0A9P5ZPE6_PLEER|nr:hypothetical protein BDN71DRAFT_1454515 [Pleurotus eryngii]
MSLIPWLTRLQNLYNRAMPGDSHAELGHRTASVSLSLHGFGPAFLVRIRPLWCGVWTG